MPKNPHALCCNQQTQHDEDNRQFNRHRDIERGLLRTIWIVVDLNSALIAIGYRCIVGYLTGVFAVGAIMSRI